MQLRLHCLNSARLARDEGFHHFANALVALGLSLSEPLPIRPDNDREVLAQLNAKRSLKEVH